MRDGMLANKSASDVREVRTAYAIRYRAYRAAQWLDEGEEELFSDSFDALPNARTYLLFKGHEAVGTIRANVWTGEAGWDDVPCFHIHGRDLLEQVGNGRARFLELSRLALDPELKAGVRDAQLALFNNAAHAADSFGCRYLIMTVRSSHAPFYERLYFERRTDPTPYPGLNVSTQLMVMDWQRSRALIEADPRFGRVFHFTRW
jgi:hypothetical protein